MNLKTIGSKKEYQQYLDWINEMLDKKVSPETPEGEKLQDVLLLIRQYEDQHYPIPKIDALDIIKGKMCNR